MGRRAHHKHSDAGPDDAKADLAVTDAAVAVGHLHSRREVLQAVEEAPGRERSRAPVRRSARPGAGRPHGAWSFQELQLSGRGGAGGGNRIRIFSLGS